MILKSKREGWCQASTLVLVCPIIIMIILLICYPILRKNSMISHEQFKQIDNIYNENVQNENTTLKTQYSILSYRIDDKNKYISLKFTEKLSYKVCSKLANDIYENYEHNLKYLHINNKNIVYRNQNKKNINESIVESCKNNDYNTINFSLNKNTK